MAGVSSVHGFDGIYDYVEILPNPPCPRCRKPMTLIKNEGAYVCVDCGIRVDMSVVFEWRLWF